MRTPGLLCRVIVGWLSSGRVTRKPPSNTLLEVHSQNIDYLDVAESTSASAETHISRPPRLNFAPVADRFCRLIMKRLLPVLLTLLYFEVGVLLVLIPWSSVWTRNYFVH